MKKYLNWTQLQTQVELLCNDITEHVVNTTTGLSTPREFYRGVYGIPRGGLIIAVMMSHRLGIPYTDRLQSLYGEKFLVVDDIADTGTTLEQMKAEVFQNAEFATIHYNEQSVVEPNFWVSKKNSDWIVYPWERGDSKPIQDYKLEQEST